MEAEKHQSLWKLSPYVRVLDQCNSKEIHEFLSFRRQEKNLNTNTNSNTNSNSNSNKNKNKNTNTKPKSSLPALRMTYVQGLEIDWSNIDFEKQKLNWDEIQERLSLKMKQRIEFGREVAQFLWKRTLKQAQYLHLPDGLIHPKTRNAVFPQNKLQVESALEEGYIPLAVADGYRYSVLGVPGTEHCGIYLGMGYGGHLVVDKSCR